MAKSQRVDTCLHLDDSTFTASILVNGSKLPCYSPKISLRRASCYIASQPDEIFVVEFDRGDCEKHKLQVILSIDGNRVDSHLQCPEDPESANASRFEEIDTPTGLKEFRFPTTLNDELYNNYRKRGLLPSLGTIRLDIHRALYVRRAQADSSQHPSTQSIPVDSLNSADLGIIFSNKEESAEDYSSDTDARSFISDGFGEYDFEQSDLLGTFIFRYRSKGFLRNIGMSLRKPLSSAAAANVPRPGASSTRPKRLPSRTVHTTISKYQDNAIRRDASPAIESENVHPSDYASRQKKQRTIKITVESSPEPTIPVNADRRIERHTVATSFGKTSPKHSKNLYKPHQQSTSFIRASSPRRGIHSGHTSVVEKRRRILSPKPSSSRVTGTTPTESHASTKNSSAAKTSIPVAANVLGPETVDTSVTVKSEEHTTSTLWPAGDQGSRKTILVDEDKQDKWDLERLQELHERKRKIKLEDDNPDNNESEDDTEEQISALIRKLSQSNKKRRMAKQPKPTVIDLSLSP